MSEFSEHNSQPNRLSFKRRIAEAAGSIALFGASYAVMKAGGPVGSSGELVTCLPGLAFSVTGGLLAYRAFTGDGELNGPGHEGGNGGGGGPENPNPISPAPTNGNPELPTYEGAYPDSLLHQQDITKLIDQLKDSELVGA